MRAFSHTLLGCLIHDVNLVHGVVERLGLPLPAAPLVSGHWADGKAASASLRLSSGVGCHLAWLLLEGLQEFRETASFYFADSVHRLHFPAPYLRQQPTVHEIVSASEQQHRVERRATVGDSYRAELEHFYGCVTDGVACLAPPEQGRLDIATLRDLFLADGSGEM